MAMLINQMVPGKRLHNELEKSTMLLMGKSPINGPFSTAMLNYRRVVGVKFGL